MMNAQCKPQMDSLLEGFYEIIPKKYISLFDSKELEFLFCGLPSINIEDWQKNTEYSGYTRDSPQIKWFWQVAQNLSLENRAKLLQFCTGTSKVPVDGFKALQGGKFSICKDYNIEMPRLPTVHTCFNQLILPIYESFDVLQDNILRAICECENGFGFL